MIESQGVLHTFQALLNLAAQARNAQSAREAGFLVANETRHLLAYRQSALWLRSEGLYTLSGVVQIEANVPYAQWVSAVFKHWQQALPEAPIAAPQTQDAAPSVCRAFSAQDLPSALSADWDAWWPSHALWVSFESGALVFVRDQPWSEPEQLLMREWIAIWGHEFVRCHRPPLKSAARWLESWRESRAGASIRPWWKRPVPVGIGLALLLLLLPVRLTVLASAELTPLNPVVIRSPLDGVIDTFHVHPNQQVRKDQLLFGFDEALTQSRLDVATQALLTAEAEYRQTVHQAMLDARVKSQLSVLTGKIEEKRAEVEFLSGQLERARVLAPQEGVVLMDEPSEWIGRPVSVGERILRIAAPGDAEVEAWLALSDAIQLESGAEVSLYLNASPLNAVKARVRYVAHDAVQRPDGQYAYRVRAELTEKTAHRVGLKGTAKLHGGWVPLAYWVFRRPMASVRAYLGI